MTDGHGERLAAIETKLDTLIGTVTKFSDGDGFARCATRKAQISELEIEHLFHKQRDEGAIPSLRTKSTFRFYRKVHRSVVKLAITRDLGSRDRGFETLHSDQRECSIAVITSAF